MSYHFRVKQPLAVFFEFELRISHQFWISNYLHEQGNAVWLWDRNQRSYYNHAILDLINPGYLLQSPIVEMSVNKCLVPSLVFVGKTLVSIHDNVGKWLITPPAIEGEQIKCFNWLWRESSCATDSLLVNVLGTMDWTLYWKTYCWLAGCWLLLFSFLPVPFISLHVISFQFISSHLILSHFISFRFISSHFVSFHSIPFHFISSHLISSHVISFHFISFRFVSFHSVSFHFISWAFRLVCPMARHPSRVERTGIGMYRINWRQVVVLEMPGTTLKISKLHCQPSRQPLVETCPGVDEATKNKNWKTKKDMGLANKDALPMEMFGRMEHNSNADSCMADTYGFLCWIFDPEVVRVEVKLTVVVSLHAQGAACGQAGSTRLPCIFFVMFLQEMKFISVWKWISRKKIENYPQLKQRKKRRKKRRKNQGKNQWVAGSAG